MAVIYTSERNGSFGLKWHLASILLKVPTKKSTKTIMIRSLNSPYTERRGHSQVVTKFCASFGFLIEPNKLHLKMNWNNGYRRDLFYGQEDFTEPLNHAWSGFVD